MLFFGKTITKCSKILESAVLAHYLFTITSKMLKELQTLEKSLIVLTLSDFGIAKLSNVTIGH